MVASFNSLGMETGNPVLILLTFLLLTTSVQAVETSQNLGVGTKVNVQADYSSHGILTELDKYCRYYEIQFCRHKVKISNPVITLKAFHHFYYIDAEAWYWENKVTGEPMTIHPE